jgi:nucleoside-diphosphate-sugar epimerase
LTGSVFEPGEGAGSQGLPAFSPYGLSKRLTAQVVEYYCGLAGMSYGKFVIPNPFGPFEEPRFTQYLVRSWYEGKTPGVNTPAYVRDNIHASLLAKAYAAFAGSLSDEAGATKLNPSGYIESQGDFALRFAHEMRGRLGLPCEVTLAHQTEFSEPRIRVNTDMLDADALGWNEAAAWDELARYYQQVFAGQAT